MKKVVKIALLAFSCTAMMVACKDKNSPDNPANPDLQNDTTDVVPTKTAEEIYDEWMDIDETLAMDVSAANLKDLWQKTFEANVEKASKNVSYIRVQNETSHDSAYVDLKDDMSLEDYYFYSQEVNGVNVNLVKTLGGEWSVDAPNKQVSFTYPYYKASQTYTVCEISASRMLLSHENFNTISGKDEIIYEGYERRAALPALPENPVNRLAANQWRVMADSVRVSVFKPEKAGDFSAGEYVYTETKKGVFPQFCILSFAQMPDTWSMLLLESKDGKVLGSYEWSDESIVDPIEKALFLVQQHDGDIEFPEEMRFIPDLKDHDKAFFGGYRIKDVTVEGKTQRQRWDYFIHAEKVY